MGNFHCSALLLDTALCGVVMGKLAHTHPFGPYSTPARGGVWVQKQRDKPKYHEAKPSGIWAYRVVFAGQKQWDEPKYHEAKPSGIWVH